MKNEGWLVNDMLYDIVLASASPQRRQLLAQLGIAFRVVTPDIDESPLAGEAAADYVMRIAQLKAYAANDRVGNPSAVIIAADTCIEFESSILGKPADLTAAALMLRVLSGREHRVHSAVCVTTKGATQCQLNTSRVRLRPLSDSEISAYCSTGEPLDKAGAYAIQGLAAMFIAEIHGSYSAIMGLPLFETAELLSKLNPPPSPFSLYRD